jgi:hypothetical protein
MFAPPSIRTRFGDVLARKCLNAFAQFGASHDDIYWHELATQCTCSVHTLQQHFASRTDAIHAALAQADTYCDTHLFKPLRESYQPRLKRLHSFLCAVDALFIAHPECVFLFQAPFCAHVIESSSHAHVLETLQKWYVALHPIIESLIGTEFASEVSLLYISAMQGALKYAGLDEALLSVAQAKCWVLDAVYELKGTSSLHNTP